MAKAVSDMGPEDFEPHRGDTFSLSADGAVIALKLTEVRRLGTALREGGAFSLTFQSAAGPILRQAIYPITHPALDTLDLFIVPLGPKDGDNRYEAIFT